MNAILIAFEGRKELLSQIFGSKKPTVRSPKGADVEVQGEINSQIFDTIFGQGKQKRVNNG